jgi:hypothetical protein
LLGNHEDWMLRAMRDPTRHSWIFGMEAFDTIASYSASAAEELRSAMLAAGPKLVMERIELPYSAFFSTLPETHIAFFESLASYHRTTDAICVHGGLDPHAGAVEQQDPERLVWGGKDFVDQYQGEDVVVYGHWANAQLDSEGWPHPMVQNRTMGIDTIAHRVLTAVRLPDRSVFQSGRY